VEAGGGGGVGDGAVGVAPFAQEAIRMDSKARVRRVRLSIGISPGQLALTISVITGELGPNGTTRAMLGAPRPLYTDAALAIKGQSDIEGDRIVYGSKFLVLAEGGLRAAA
jgi:hypothetical protein